MDFSEDEWSPSGALSTDMVLHTAISMPLLDRKIPDKARDFAFREYVLFLGKLTEIVLFTDSHLFVFELSFISFKAETEVSFQ